MSQIYDRLTGSTKDHIIREATAEGVSMTELIRAVVSAYLNWKQRKAHESLIF
jgi:hypothetical protein